METGLAMILPGVVGGLVLAGVLAWLNRTPSSTPKNRSALEPISPDMINMAHIRVAGVGGLGMMAVSLVIAINLPEIGFALLVAAALGAIIGGGLILYRSRSNQSGQGGHGDVPPSVVMLHHDPQRTDSQSDRPLPGNRATAIA